MLQRVKALCFFTVLSFYSQAFSDVNPAFKVLMMADPQAFRVCEEKFAQRCPANAICCDGNTCKASQVWKKRNMPVVSGINKLINRAKLSEMPIEFGIMNGNLTESGQEYQKRLYQKVYRYKIAVPIYEGLGNKDLMSHQGDCALLGYGSEHACAIRMINYMRARLKNYENNVSDKSNFSYDWTAKIHQFISNRGSLAYSFDYHGIHFVQLQNFPSYSAQYHAYNWLYEIKQSLDWLDQDLALATQRGNKIILSWHDGNNNILHDEVSLKKLKAILLKYAVSAIFVGQSHRQEYTNFLDTNIPMYVTDALFFGGYYVVSFKKEMMVVDYYTTKFKNSAPMLISSREQHY